MTDPHGFNPYQRQCEDAEKLFDDDDSSKCIAAAKSSLNNPMLPPYYIIKNCILIACAMDNWEDADKTWVSAEQVYTTPLKNATRKQDTRSLKILQILRQDLDELNEFKREDLAELAFKNLLSMELSQVEDDSLDDHVVDGKDDGGVGRSDQTVVAIRSASGKPDPTVSTV